LLGTPTVRARGHCGILQRVLPDEETFLPAAYIPRASGLTEAPADAAFSVCRDDREAGVPNGRRSCARWGGRTAPVTASICPPREFWPQPVPADR
jgi:hypothetical protein